MKAELFSPPTEEVEPLEASEPMTATLGIKPMTASMTPPEVTTVETAGALVQNVGHAIDDTFEQGVQGLIRGGAAARDREKKAGMPQFGFTTPDQQRSFADSLEGVVSDIIPKKELPENASINQKFIAEDVGAGLGSAAAFVGLAKVKWPVALATMAGVGFEGQSEDAARHGADLPTQDTAGTTGALIETGSETLGTKAILDAMKASGIKGRALAIITGGGINAFQEMAAGMMNDLVAKYDLAYDPERDIWQERGKEGAVGGIVGSLLSALMTVRGGKRKGSSADDSTQPFEPSGQEGEFIPSEADIHKALEEISRAGELFEGEVVRPELPAPEGTGMTATLDAGAAETVGVGFDVTGVGALPAPTVPQLGMDTATDIVPPHIATITPTVILASDDFLPPPPSPDIVLLEAQIAEERRIADVEFQASLPEILKEQGGLVDDTELRGEVEGLYTTPQNPLDDAEIETLGLNTRPVDTLPNLTISETLMYEKLADKVAMGEELSQALEGKYLELDARIQNSGDGVLLRRTSTKGEDAKLAADAAEGQVLENAGDVGKPQVLNTLPVAITEKVIQKFEKSFEGAPPHVLFTDIQQVPEQFRDKTSAKAFFVAAHTLPDGSVVPGLTYINANKFKTAEEVFESLVHEDITHSGSRAFFRQKGDTPEVTEERVRDFYENLYFEKGFQKEIDNFNAAVYKYDTASRQGRAKAAEEWVAKISEARKGKKATLWNRIVAKFLKLIRSIPYLKNTKFAKDLRKADIETFITKAFKATAENVTPITPQVSEQLSRDIVGTVAGMIDTFTLGDTFTQSQLREYMNKNDTLQGQRAVLEYTLNLPQFKKESKIQLNSFLEAIHMRLTDGTELTLNQIHGIQKGVKAAYLRGDKQYTVRSDPRLSTLLSSLYADSRVVDGATIIPANANNARVIQPLQHEGVDRIVEPMMQTDFSDREVAAQAYQIDRFNSYYKHIANLMQMTSANEHIPGVLQYWVASNQMTTYARELATVADETLQVMRKMPEKDTDNMFQFMMDQTFYFREHGTWMIPIEGLDETLIPRQEVVTGAMEHYSMSEEMLAMYQRVVGDYQMIMDVLEVLGMEEIQRNHAENPEVLEVQLAALANRMRGYKRMPYAPAMRFGKYTYRATYKADVLDDEGKVVHKKKSTYEYGAVDFAKKKLRDKRVAELKAEGYQITKSFQPDEETRNLGMLNKDFFLIMQDHLELNAEQKTELGRLMDEYNPSIGMTKHLRRRSGIKGWSDDGPRAYAAYMQTAAYALAKAKYRPMLLQAKGLIRDSMENIYSSEGESLAAVRGGDFNIDTGKRAQILEWYEKHYQYATSNQAESSIASTLAYVNFIWAAPKAVFVNFTQPFVQTLPYLGARYGYPQTMTEMTRAVYALRDIINKPERDVGDDTSRLAVAAAHRAGVFNETLMRELGNAANGQNLAMTQLPSHHLRPLQQLLWWGSAPFQFSEKVNRFITFVATFNLEYKRLEKEGRIDENDVITILPSDEHSRLIKVLSDMPDHMLIEAEWEKHPAYVAARRSVENTQFIFSRINRPQFMRNFVGRMAGVFQTPFLGIQHNMLGGDKAYKGMLAMVALLAGYEGLPYVQTTMGVADTVATKFIEVAALEGIELPVNTKEELRAAIGEVIDNPDYIAGGAFKLSGIPNLTSSVSMGDPFRIGETLRTTALQTSSMEDAGAIESILSAFVIPSMTDDFVANLADANMTGGGSLLAAMPGFGKHLFKYKQRLDAGGVYTRGGVRIVEFGEGQEGDGTVNPHGISWLSSAVGFPPEDLTLAYEDYKRASDGAKYWTARRADLMSAAKQTHTPEQEARVDKAIKVYNMQLPKGAFNLRLNKSKIIKLKLIRKQIEADTGLSVPKFSRDRYK